MRNNTISFSLRNALYKLKTVRVSTTGYAGLTLGAIIILSIGLHVWRISYPARPVFDEAHFATYSSDYLKRQLFIDIHPPLGKLLYADTLALSQKDLPEAIAQSDFVLIKASGATDFSITATGIPYGNFPYVPLRLFGAFFGVALAALMYFFMRSIGAGNIASLLASLFVTLENALLLETRLILLNGMYLVFGMLALTLFFRSKSYSLAGGMLWGFSLGVKLLGLAFAGPVIAYHLLQKNADAGKRAFAFFAAGCAVFGAIILANGFFYTSENRLDYWKSLGFLRSATSSERVVLPKILQRPANYIGAAAGEMLFTSSGYLAGAQETKFGNHDGSPWYAWPFMYRKMYYHVPPPGFGGALILNGNPAVWIGGTFAVLLALFYIFSRAFRGIRERKNAFVERDKIVIMLLGGYASSLILFITIVRRVTFLYHYFPALLFSIALLALFIERALGLKDGEPLNKKKRWALVLICAAAIGGFLYSAPGTFGIEGLY